jgi:hypothetical protein
VATVRTREALRPEAATGRHSIAATTTLQTA